MKLVIAWIVGLVMGAGGLLAWGIFDKRVEVAVRTGPAASAAAVPSQDRSKMAGGQQAKADDAAPVRDEFASTTVIDVASLAAAPAGGEALPLEPGETVASKFANTTVGESVTPGGSSTESGRTQ